MPESAREKKANCAVRQPHTLTACRMLEMELPLLELD